MTYLPGIYLLKINKKQNNKQRDILQNLPKVNKKGTIPNV